VSHTARLFYGPQTISNISPGQLTIVAEPLLSNCVLHFCQYNRVALKLCFVVENTVHANRSSLKKYWRLLLDVDRRLLLHSCAGLKNVRDFATDRRA